MHSRATDRRSASKCQGKMARSDPRPSVRVTRGAGSSQHLASVLQEGRENANIDAVWDSSGKSRIIREATDEIAGLSPVVARCDAHPLGAYFGCTGFFRGNVCEKGLCRVWHLY